MASDEQLGRRRPGRPPLPEGERKSANMKFRTREGLRDQLEEAARISGRSASEEVEYRLQNSFRDTELFALVAGGSRNADAVALISTILKFARTEDGTPWHEDPMKARIVARAAEQVILQCGDEVVRRRYRVDELPSPMTDLQNYIQRSANDLAEACIILRHAERDTSWENVQITSSVSALETPPAFDLTPAEEK